jgi:DNA-binding transcriptional MerR regulator
MEARLMPERNGYKTIDLIAQELGITEDQVRALIAVLDIQSRTFPDDRRPRYYSPEDIERIRQIIAKKP